MARRLSDEAIAQISREHADSVDLLYMEFPDIVARIALSYQDILFQREEESGPFVYDGVGGAIVPGTAIESTDLDSQGHDMQFVAIDPGFDFMGRILNQSLFNRIFEHHRVFFHTVGPDAGKRASQVKLHGGRMQGRFDVEDVVPESGVPPGTVLVRFRSYAPLAGLEFRKSIQTNVRSHQLHYPDDLGFNLVEHVMNTKYFFGSETPESF